MLSKDILSLYDHKFEGSLFVFVHCWNVSILVNSLEMVHTVSGSPSKECLTWVNAAIFAVTLLFAEAFFGLLNRFE